MTKKCNTCNEEKSLTKFRKTNGNRSDRCMQCAKGTRMSRANFGRTCLVKTCEREPTWKGYCNAHYQRVQKYGDPFENTPILHKDGSGSIHNGYRRLYRPEHPNASKTGSIAEHTVIMTEYLGRALVKGENVHHINGDKLDNRLDNLEIWNTNQPPGQRAEDKVAYAIEILKLYAPEKLCS